jgi:hypothetical protein
MSKPGKVTPSRTGWSNDVEDDLNKRLSAKHADAVSGPIHRVTVRLPANVVEELHLLARSRKISVNALLAIYVEQGLVADGRPPLMRLAPWFADYLTRTAKRDGGDPDSPIFT